MSKIVNMLGQELDSKDLENDEKQEPVADVVEMLKELLADAEAGKITSLTIVLVLQSQSVGFGIAGTISHPMLAGLSRVTHIVNAEMDIEMLAEGDD